jgi:hypothetical protein
VLGLQPPGGQLTQHDVVSQTSRSHALLPEQLKLQALALHMTALHPLAAHSNVHDVPEKAPVHPAVHSMTHVRLAGHSKVRSKPAPGENVQTVPLHVP